MTDLLESPLQTAPRPDRSAATLLGIGTANPESASQSEIITLAEAFNCTSDGQRAWLRRIFSRCGVDARGSVLKKGEGIAHAQSFYQSPSVIGEHGPTTAARMQRYAQEAPPLAESASRTALQNAAIAPAAITHLITLSCTGFFAPGLDSQLISRLGLPVSVHRAHVGFMGCHAMFNALALARDIVRADPAATVLVCSVELCTLHFAYGWDPEKLIANALFADGASAAVVGSPDRAQTQDSPGAPWQLLHAASMRIPDSAAAMTWQIGDHGFHMALSAELPAIISRHIRPWCESWLAERSLALADIKHWAIHPGGPKIVSAAATALGLPASATTVSHEILAQHGNMSSATVLFLLQRLAHKNAATLSPGPTVAIGFGPGLMAEGMLLTQ